MDSPPPSGTWVQRGWKRAVVDWFPLGLILLAYVVLHALGTTLTPIAHVQPQLGFDEWVFGGTAPTVRLQRELWHPGDPAWYDYLAWLVYLSHFVVSFAVGLVLWFRAYPLFRRFRALFLTVTFAGFATYVLYPAIPPWLAGRRGDMPHVVRIVRAMWLHVGLSDVAAVFGEKSKYAFPVGALPSLHAAWPFLLMVFLWPIAGRWRPVLVAYALAMAFTLVYTADHFVFDVLLGWAYVIVVVVGFRVVATRRRPRAEEPRTEERRTGQASTRRWWWKSS